MDPETETTAIPLEGELAERALELANREIAVKRMTQEAFERAMKVETDLARDFRALWKAIHDAGIADIYGGDWTLKVTGEQVCVLGTDPRTEGERNPE